MLYITIFLFCVWQFVYVVYEIFWLLCFYYIVYDINSYLNFFYILFNKFHNIQFFLMALLTSVYGRVGHHILNEEDKNRRRNTALEYHTKED